MLHRWVFMEMLESRQWRAWTRLADLLHWSTLIYYRNPTPLLPPVSALVPLSFEREAYTGRYRNSWGWHFQRGICVLDQCGEQKTHTTCAECSARLVASPVVAPPLDTFDHENPTIIWGWFLMNMIYVCIYTSIYILVHAYMYMCTCTCICYRTCVYKFNTNT